MDFITINECSVLVDIAAMAGISCDDPLDTIVGVSEDWDIEITLSNVCCSTCDSQASCTDFDYIIESLEPTMEAEIAVYMEDLQLPDIAEGEYCDFLVDLFAVMGIGCNDDLIEKFALSDLFGDLADH